MVETNSDFKYKWKYKRKSHKFSGLMLFLLSFLGISLVCPDILHDERKCNLAISGSCEQLFPIFWPYFFPEPPQDPDFSTFSNDHPLEPNLIRCVNQCMKKRKYDKTCWGWAGPSSVQDWLARQDNVIFQGCLFVMSSSCKVKLMSSCEVQTYIWRCQSYIWTSIFLMFLNCK